jgi:hypothetical protein
MYDATEAAWPVMKTAKTADKFGLRADEQAALFLASVK